MLPEPLHPVVVHFPIVFVSLLPVVAVAIWLYLLRNKEDRRAWTCVVVLAALLAGSSWLAVQTGEAEEDRVEEVVSEDAIHEHEEAAESFLFLSGGFLLLAVLGLVRGTVGQVARPLATFASVGLLVAGVRVGGTGGDLVYEHGAADAYVIEAEAPDAGSARPEPGGRGS
jgi:uncharacterized membrane protein